MLAPRKLKALKESAQREEWSAVNDALASLAAQAASNPLDALRVKGLAPMIMERKLEDLTWAIDALLRVKK